MKKTYNLGLLTGGISLMLALIASFVLQDYFSESFLTMSFTFDTFILIAVSFMLILQFKSFDKIAAIVLVIYGAFNILYGIVGSQTLSDVINSTELEVIFILGLLLGHVLFEIAVLFVLLHLTQQRFEYKFTKKFVIVALLVSLVLLISITPLVTFMTFQSIIRMVFSVISIAMLYFCIQQMVTDTPIVVEAPTKAVPNKRLELSKLYERGIITQEEYQTRLDLIDKE